MTLSMCRWEEKVDVIAKGKKGKKMFLGGIKMLSVQVIKKSILAASQKKKGMSSVLLNILVFMMSHTACCTFS